MFNITVLPLPVLFRRCLGRTRGCPLHRLRVEAQLHVLQLLEGPLLQDLHPAVRNMYSSRLGMRVRAHCVHARLVLYSMPQGDADQLRPLPKRLLTVYQLLRRAVLYGLRNDLPQVCQVGRRGSRASCP